MRWIQTRWGTVTAIVLWTCFATGLGFLLHHRWLLPVLQTLPIYGYMVYRIRQGAWRTAILDMAVWAVTLGVATTWAVYFVGPESGQWILHGPAYRKEMFQWLRTGVGMESTPAQFLPRHLIEVGVFALLSVATASLVSMHGGTVLMNYMSYYVGCLMVYSDHPVWTFLLGWKVYAVIRVFAYVILGVLLAEPLVYRILHRPYSPYPRRVWFGIAIAGLILDVVLKTWLAPHYRVWILQHVRLP